MTVRSLIWSPYILAKRMSYSAYLFLLRIYNYCSSSPSRICLLIVCSSVAVVATSLFTSVPSSLPKGVWPLRKYFALNNACRTVELMSVFRQLKRKFGDQVGLLSFMAIV